MLTAILFAWLIVYFVIKPKYAETFAISALTASIALMELIELGSLTPDSDFSAAMFTGLLGGIVVAAIVALLTLKPFIQKWRQPYEDEKKEAHEAK